MIRPRLRVRLPDLAPNEAQFLTWNERIVLRARAHPSVLVRPVLETVGVLVLAAWLTSPTGGGALDRLLAYVVMGFLLRLAWKFVDWWLEEIVVTDKRIFKRSGVLMRSVSSMPLSKVTDMTYHRSVPGRLLGYGQFILESAGEDQALSSINHLPHPDDFYRTITSLVFEDQE